MGRPRTRKPAANPQNVLPDEWPDWLLSFGRGIPSDQDSQEWISVMRDFHRWRQSRRAWFEANVGPWEQAHSWALLDAERRHRIEAHRSPRN